MKNNVNPLGRNRLIKDPPRFLFFLKRRKLPDSVEDLPKENRLAELFVMMACGCVLLGIIVLTIRVLGHHFR